MKNNILNLGSIALVGGISNSGLRYLMYLLIGQRLGAEPLGQFSFGLMLLGVGGVVAKFGLDNAALKFVPRYLGDDENERLTGMVILSLVIPLAFGSVIAAVLYLSRTAIEGVTTSAVQSVIPLFVIGIPITAAMIVGKSLTRGFKETKYDVYINNAQSGVAVVGVLVVTALSYGILTVVATYVLSLAVGVVISIIILYYLGAFSGLPSPEFETSKLLRFSGPILFMAIALKLMSVTDVFMLGVFEEASAIGIYQSAFQTALFLTMALSAVNSIFPSVASELYDNNEMEKLNRMYSVVSKWLFSVTVLGFIFVVVFGETILGLFGAEFQAGWYLLIVLAAGQTVTAITGPAGFLLIMTGNEQIEMFNTLSTTILNVILNAILISIFGPIGAAIGTGVAISLLNVLRMIQVQLTLDMLPFSNEYARHVFGIVIVAPLPILIHEFVFQGSILVMLLIGIVTLGVFFTVMIGTGLDESDRLLLESVQ